MRQKEPMRRSTLILWGIVIQLWILNLVVLFFLNQARLTTIENLSKAETMLDKLANEVVSYDIQVNRPIPLKADIPFKQKLDIPINTVIPIDREIQVPFKTPAGDVMIDVPLKTDFPIDIVVPIDFNQTVNVDTVVQLDTTVPVEIVVAKTPLLGYLEQIKLDLVRLRSRLSFQNEAAAAETAAISISNEAAKTGAASNSEQPEGATVAEKDSPSDGAGISQTNSGDAVTSDDLVMSVTQGDCAHPYWPLQSGTKWTYDSPTTSFTQQVDTIDANQVVLSSQYEGQTIKATLACSHEGLGSSFLGDMRRLSEWGDLTFKAVTGVFLPRPEVLEKQDASWMQEFEVTGTVQGSQADTLVNGRVTQGQAKAVYTVSGVETVDTPLGPKEALRIEQKLNFDLNIDFGPTGSSVPATEVVDLTTTYWFVKDVGLAAVHWQGGSLQQNLQGEQSYAKNISIPGLPEDKLVIVCASSGEQSSNCKRNAGVAEGSLTVAASELDIPGFILPEMGASAASSDTANLADSSGLNNSGDGDSNGNPVDSDNPEESPQNNEQTALLQYATTIDNLNEKIADAAQDFGDAAIKFRDDQMSLDEFKSKHADFAPKIKQLIKDLNALKPPSSAKNIHIKLTSGLAKCEQSSSMLSEWFSSFDPSLKQAGTLLVANCIDQVTEAGNELNQLVASNPAPQ